MFFVCIIGSWKGSTLLFLNFQRLLVIKVDKKDKIIPARDPKQCENKNKMQCMCDHSM